jgi:hypothetical protein
MSAAVFRPTLWCGRKALVTIPKLSPTHTKAKILQYSFPTNWEQSTTYVPHRCLGDKATCTRYKYLSSHDKNENADAISGTHAGIMMVDEDDAADADIVLQTYDFPEHYVDKAHPEDGVVVDAPIVPEFIRHSRRGHFRMLVRFSLRLDDASFAPFTFVCDTGAPGHLYLSESAMGLLEKAGRIKSDELGPLYIESGGEKIVIRVTPHMHQPANLMGMLLLERFQLKMVEGGFTFDCSPRHL